MDVNYIEYNDFREFLIITVKDRVSELVKEIQCLEYIKKDRGFWRYEQLRYDSLGAILEINEAILKSFDPEYTSIQ